MTDNNLDLGELKSRDVGNLISKTLVELGKDEVTMLQQNVTLHETMEIHALLNLKKACLIKSKMLQDLITDQQLKGLMEKDVQQSTAAIDALNSLLSDTNRI